MIDLFGVIDCQVRLFLTMKNIFLEEKNKTPTVPTNLGFNVVFLGGRSPFKPDSFFVLEVHLCVRRNK
jgi:hypothetical protein